MTARQQAITVPIEDLILSAAEQLTETAYERFTEGVFSQMQLKDFYDVVRDWSKASERVLETMQKLDIRA